MNRVIISDVNKPHRSNTVLRSSGRFVPVTADQVRKYQLATEVRDILPNYVGGVAVDSLWLERPLGGAWRVAYRLIPQTRARSVRHVIAEVRVFPAETGAPPGEWSGSLIGMRAASTVPPGGLPARIMNQVRSTHTYGALRAHLEWLENKEPGAAGAFLEIESSPPPGRGRPPKKTIVGYREFAGRYAVTEVGRHAQSTRKVLARHYRVSEDTIAYWIRRARMLGLLPKTKAGQRGRSSAALSEIAANAALRANQKLTDRPD